MSIRISMTVSGTSDQTICFEIEPGPHNDAGPFILSKVIGAQPHAARRTAR